MKNSAPVVACEGVYKSYTSGGETQAVLRGVNFSVAAGEVVAVVGSSGSGKTTLLHLLGGLDAPDAGAVTAGGRDLSGMKDDEKSAWRNGHIAYIFQFHLLLPEFTALENAAMPLLLRRLPRAHALAAAADCLRAVDMTAHAHKTPEKLSGGERQRVAVARALAGRPACILADEPTGNLDRKNADAVFDLLLSAGRARETALILVSHDERLAKRADKILTLRDGVLAAA